MKEDKTWKEGERKVILFYFNYLTVFLIKLMK